MTTAMFDTRCKAVFILWLHSPTRDLFQAKDQERHKRTTMYYDNSMRIPKNQQTPPMTLVNLWSPTPTLKSSIAARISASNPHKTRFRKKPPPITQIASETPRSRLRTLAHLNPRLPPINPWTIPTQSLKQTHKGISHQETQNSRKRSFCTL